MRKFTMQDNNVCVGYARLALDIYNDRIKTAQTECDYQDEYYDNHVLSETEKQNILSCLYGAFDRFTEEDAFTYKR